MKNSKPDGATRATDAKPTFSQASRILAIIEEKVETREQLQKFQASGLLTDLLSADPDKIDRNEFRRTCGHPVSPWRILVGDPSWQMDHRLRRDGHYAESVTSMSTTIKEFRAGKFNLVLLHPWDDWSSKEKCDEIKRLDPNCKIVLFVSERGMYADHNADGQVMLGSGVDELYEWMKKQ